MASVLHFIHFFLLPASENNRKEKSPLLIKLSVGLGSALMVLAIALLIFLCNQRRRGENVDAPMGYYALL